MLRERTNGNRITAKEKTSPIRVAYIMSRFPKLTETFILYEILALEAEEMFVSIYPLFREQSSVLHEEAERLVHHAHYTPLFSWPILRANVHFLRHKPRTYLQTLWDVLRANWGSPRYFAAALALFPKSAYLAHRMQQEQIQHIHSHFASHPAAVAFIVHRLTDIPYSFTAHGSDLHRDQHMLREKVKEAAFVVPISIYNREFILDHCGPALANKMIVIHCGVDTASFRPSMNHNGWQPDTFRILCIGTLHEVKGQEYLIAAMEQLSRQGLNVRCDFVGDGPDRLQLKRQVHQAGLDGCIHFHGEQTRVEVLQHLHNADVLVTPSVPSSDGRREGIPVVLMEAMACGLPVVASRLSGIPELVHDDETGLLVEPRDVTGLTTALTKLYCSPALRQQLGQAAREKVLAEFDLTRNAARLAHYFREVVQ